MNDTLFGGSNSELQRPDGYRFRFIDLFAGIGGMRIAFESFGGDCVFSSEWDESCKKTYFANFNEVPFGDITAINANSIPEFDILLAGFPCQPFSTIGQRAGFLHKTQGTLFYDVLRIINHKKPIAFLLENVVGLVNHDKGRTFETIKDSLISEGYDLHYKILDSAAFGVPQIRKRIYIVGFLKSANNNGIDFDWPEPEKHLVGIGQFLESNVIGYSISEHLQKSYIFKLNDGRPQIVDKKSEFPVKTLVASYHKIQRLTGTFVSDGPTGLRLFTESECKVIMGFPSDFQIPVSRTQMYRQMGNSVAVPVIKAIADKMTLVLSNMRKGKKAKISA